MSGVPNRLTAALADRDRLERLLAETRRAACGAGPGARS